MFPRGKVDELETDVACAVREVKEELGVDISGVIRPNVCRVQLSRRVIARSPVDVYRNH